MRKNSAWPHEELYIRNRRAEMVRSGPEYFRRLSSIIKNTEKVLHLQVYILEDDDTGLSIINDLKEAVKRGVEVNVVVDAFGSNTLSDRTIRDIRDSGITFREFSPFYTSKGLSIGRRMHQKIVVSDSILTLIGGINISDQYHGTAKEKAWIDYAVLIEGPVAREGEAICLDILRKKSFFQKSSKVILPRFEKQEGNTIPARLLLNDWLRRKRQISGDYKHAFRQADKSILLLAAYFLPGRQLTNLIMNAAKRGVEVKIILSGISDVPLVKRATSYLYSRLLKSGVQIYECSNAVVHGKVAVVDNIWSTVGSYNMNHLSDYGSIELNADILDRKFAATLTEELQRVIEKSCVQITMEEYDRKSTFVSHAMDWSAHKLMRASMQLFFFLVRKSFRRQ
jgi:cardiolipin synthase